MFVCCFSARFNCTLCIAAVTVHFLYFYFIFNSSLNPTKVKTTVRDLRETEDHWQYLSVTMILLKFGS